MEPSYDPWHDPNQSLIIEAEPKVEDEEVNFDLDDLFSEEVSDELPELTSDLETGDLTETLLSNA